MLNKLLLPRLVRGFAFVSTKAVLVSKRRRSFGTHKPKAPLCKGSWRRRRLRDCFAMKFFLLQSLRLACASHLPLHKGGSLPPDSTPKRCNTLYLAEQGVWKGVRTNCSYSFCCRAGVYLPPLYYSILFVFGGSKPPPYKDAAGKTCFMEGTPCGCFFCVSSFRLWRKHLSEDKKST